MKTKLAVFVIMLLLFTIQTPAQRNRVKDGGRCLKESKLNLTDAQKTQLKDLRDKHFSASANLRDELAKLRIDKRAMLRDENLDRSNYLALENKMNDLRGKLSELRAEHQMDVYEMLTDEQKKEFRNSPMGMKNKGEMREKRGFRHRNNK